MKLKTKKRIVMFIDYFEKQDDRMILNDSQMVQTTRKELEESLNQDAENGIKRQIQYVNKKPMENIQLGVLYILRTPKNSPDRVYTYQLNG